VKIRILGAGWYGCHLALALRDEHEVEIHEAAGRIFAGASGKIPARLHQGAHYPRSHKTRAACQRHTTEFMERYGFLTRGVPVNIYAIAEDRSHVDFDQYVATLRNEFDFIPIYDPREFGLRNVEGAILTGERHILAEDARRYFEQKLHDIISFGHKLGVEESPDFDLTIDCTFCSNHSAGVDRYEPCLVLLMEGLAERAVTIMDGPFPSLYPWSPDRGLCSLSSALWTPFSKEMRTYEEAKDFLFSLTRTEIVRQGERMFESMASFYPAVKEFEIVEHMTSIRAMPLSGADTRLVDVAMIEPDFLRVRAGKIDAVLDAEGMVREIIG